MGTAWPWPCRHSGCQRGVLPPPGLLRALLLVLRSSGLHWALSGIINAVQMQVGAARPALRMRGVCPRDACMHTAARLGWGHSATREHHRDALSTAARARTHCEYAMHR